jgi:hypothetical protein
MWADDAKPQRHGPAAAEVMGGRVNKEVSFAVGIVVERRPAASRWIDWIWRPLAALEGMPDAEPYTCLSEDPDGTATYYVGSKDVILYPKGTDGYLLNLSSGGALYVTLRRAEGAPLPYALHSVTASPYEAESQLVSGEEIVEPVPMPRAVRETVEAFCEAHPYEEVFEKRQRDPGRKKERQQFGKEPIFDRAQRSVRRGGGRDGE